ncbi:hypothetical protein BGZ73_008520 [Actinomortierella ambigua]|nr:hypothetical protein BGZ73_008520 [Actinomortierella ambigua]
MVGYRNGNVPLPIAPVRVTLKPSGNPLLDDCVRIQAAINKVGKMPLQPFTLRDGTRILLRGAVLLRAGIYRVRGSLILNKDGVVLRGEGNGPQGTIIQATGDFIHDFIHLNGMLDPATQGSPEYQIANGTTPLMRPINRFLTGDGYATAVSKVYVPVGTMRVPVEDIRPFRAGAQVIVERPATAAWIHLLGMDRIPPRSSDPASTVQWDPTKYTLSFARQVVKIQAKDPKKQAKAEKGLPKNPDGRDQRLRLPRYPDGELSYSSFDRPQLDFPHPVKPPPQNQDPEHTHWKQTKQAGDDNNNQRTYSDWDTWPLEDWNWALDDFDDYRLRGKAFLRAALLKRTIPETRTSPETTTTDNEDGIRAKMEIGPERLGIHLPIVANGESVEANAANEDDSAQAQPRARQSPFRAKDDIDRPLGDPIPGDLFIDVPIVMPLDPQYGGGYVYNYEKQYRLPSDIGVENLQLVSSYNTTNRQDEQHAWYAVLIDHCQNCWVADVVTRQFVSGIKAASDTFQTTIQDCEAADPISVATEGGTRYMFMLQGQLGLVKRCRARNGRHDFITGSRTSGPNAFVDSEGLNANNDAGPHERWAVGTLYDNIRSFRINIQNRGNYGTGHGWAGAFHVMYHCDADNPALFQSPPGATNWIVAFNGTFADTSTKVFPGEDATHLEPQMQDLFPVNKVPRSLYWSQLVQRLGGDNDDKVAMRVEELVGAKGKNQYPPTSPYVQ